MQGDFHTLQINSKFMLLRRLPVVIERPARQLALFALLFFFHNLPSFNHPRDYLV
jgi:hypothetical protein